MFFKRRFAALLAVAAVFFGLVALAWLHILSWDWAALMAVALAFGMWDLVQTRHAVLRNYPIWGHLRFLFEFIRPEMRQYFIEDENSGRPFSRQQRSIVYQRAKGDIDSRPFGTELDVMQSGYEWIGHSLQPAQIGSHDFRVTVGAERAQPYAISLFNISAMSFGALSANAIRALNRGAKMGGFAHDTGEGSISPYHREAGGDLIW